MAITFNVFFYFYIRKQESVSPNGAGCGDDEDRLVIAEDETPPPDEKKPAVKTEKKPRKKHNRFNGMSEEEVAKRILPDLLAEGLQILIVSFQFSKRTTVFCLKPYA